MTRRWALAGALFLTATFGFLVVALGSQAGVFAWGRDADATGTTAGAVASPTPDPRIITEYVVVDATPAADASAQAAPGDEGGADASAYTDDDAHEGEGEDDEREGEHHDDDHDADHEEHEAHDDD